MPVHVTSGSEAPHLSYSDVLQKYLYSPSYSDVCYSPTHTLPPILQEQFISSQTVSQLYSQIKGWLFVRQIWETGVCGQGEAHNEATDLVAPPQAMVALIPSAQPHPEDYTLKVKRLCL